VVPVRAARARKWGRLLVRRRRRLLAAHPALGQGGLTRLMGAQTAAFCGRLFLCVLAAITRKPCLRIQPQRKDPLRGQLT
jgi:hypothetical protein